MDFSPFVVQAILDYKNLIQIIVGLFYTIGHQNVANL